MKLGKFAIKVEQKTLFVLTLTFFDSIANSLLVSQNLGVARKYVNECRKF